MALKIIRGSENAPLTPLISKTVAILGFGNQGHAHALNLRETGIRVVVANPPDTPNGRNAKKHGFTPVSIASAVRDADLVIITLPDESQPEIYQQAIEPHLKSGATIGFTHGFNIKFGLIRPRTDLGVIMVAPKGPGRLLRERFVNYQGLPCLFAMHQDSANRDAQGLGLAWASGIGCARAGIIFTSFEAEANADLFGEQAVLCGGMTELILAAFETLVQAGYPPELAYLECCHEVKQIADLVYERGIAAMMESISNTAEFGAYQAGPIVIGEPVREAMQYILKRIEDGTFAKTMRHDYQQGFPWFHEQRERLREHVIESAGKTIRSLMPWLNESKDNKPL